MPNDLVEIVYPGLVWGACPIDIKVPFITMKEGIPCASRSDSLVAVVGTGDHPVRRYLGRFHAGLIRLGRQRSLI